MFRGRETAIKRELKRKGNNSGETGISDDVVSAFAGCAI
jgi:hypothetical protein